MIETTRYLLKTPENTDPADLRLFVGDNMAILETEIGRIDDRVIDWTEVTGKPTTFTPPLMSGGNVGGARVGYGLAMSGEYLFVKTGLGIVADTVDNSIDVDVDYLDARYSLLAHAHTITDITGLDTELGTKVSKSGDTMTATLNIENNAGGGTERSAPLLRLANFTPSIDLVDLSTNQRDFPLRIENNGNGLEFNILNGADYSINSQLFKIANSNLTYKEQTVWHEGNLNPANFLVKVGDTMTGTLTWDTTYYLTNGGALNLKNGDIIGVNSIVMNDTANASIEGIAFLKDGATVGSTTTADYHVFRITGDGKVQFDGNEMWHSLNLDPNTFVRTGTSLTDGFIMNFNANDQSGLIIEALNYDVNVFRVGNDRDEYGFDLRYMGSGNGNDNLLKLISHNQTTTYGSPIDIVNFYQDGTTKFLQSMVVEAEGVNLLTLSAKGPAHFLIEADTDNVNENDNAMMVFTQDAGTTRLEFGIDTTNNAFIRPFNYYNATNQSVQDFNWRDNSGINHPFYHAGRSESPKHLSFQNGWTNYFSTAFDYCKYWKSQDGTVVVVGLASSGSTGANIAVLPVGYRPKATHIFTCFSYLGACRIDVKADGSIYANSNTHATFTSLCGITFKAEN